MNAETISRDDLAAEYVDRLIYELYPVQEEALLTWFTSEAGVLVCAPTGTGKTVIAEAAIFEALRLGKRAYYTTPLIALTEQKLADLQETAKGWGYSADDIGLVTGNRRVNPDAPILVVVAEILLNRLLHPDAFNYEDVHAVVMDEFHSFNDAERGVVWELSLALLPQHVKLLLLSATVGNAYEFTRWLRHSHDRKIELVQSEERKVPLTYHWNGDSLLNEFIEEIARGDEKNRRTPALVFCFNREECWNVAEQLKGKKLIDDRRQKLLTEELSNHDWSRGVGPKLRQTLLRGVGVHHAGVLPQYKRIVERLFQRKMLAVTVCTETLAAGINLPARSVVIPSLLKGPPEKKKLIEASAAHQMFGRAGRPQFDSEGFVYALAHEDDVRISRWREKFDQIPTDTKDPGLLKARKALKKKMPTRRANQQYWTEQQFQKICTAPASDLQSRGPIPWRLLAYLLGMSPEVERIRELVGKRLLNDKQRIQAGKQLNRMLMTLWRAGHVKLEPEPPKNDPESQPIQDDSRQHGQRNSLDGNKVTFPELLLGGGVSRRAAPGKLNLAMASEVETREANEEVGYQPEFAHPTPTLKKLMLFRSVNPLFGMFLINQLGIADQQERIQALESVLAMPRSLGRTIYVPKHDVLPPGPLAINRLDGQLLQLGLAAPEELTETNREEDDEHRDMLQEDRVFVLSLAEKLRRLFDFEFPSVHDVRTTPVWVAGELLDLGGDFNQYITSNRLQKQEGIIFRHLLRMILLTGEFVPIVPAELTEREWETDLGEIRDRIVEVCRGVDPLSTDKAVEEAESDRTSEHG